MAFDIAHRLIDRLGSLPGLQHVRRARAARRWRRGMGPAFDGVFDSYAAAQASAPAGLPTSYDNPASARMYVDRLAVDDYDYAPLFWLRQGLGIGMRHIADVGGSTGIKFFAFEPLLELPADARWQVIEVPAAVTAGREIAAAQGVAAVLEFSSQMRDAEGCDVFMASGSLQYLPQSIGEILAEFRTKPRRILINTTPVHPTRSFFTRNNIGTAYCAYRVTAHDEFVEQVVGHGYRLRDEWRNVGKRLDLPHERGCSLEYDSGFCFDREGAAG